MFKIIMSNLIVNIRFWYWHLQVGKKLSSLRWVRNKHLSEIGLEGVSKIEIY